MQKEKKIYIPSKLTIEAKTYNNGIILWISGQHATLYKYLKNNSFTLSGAIIYFLKKNEIKINYSKLMLYKHFFNVYKKQELKKNNLNINLMYKQINQTIINAITGTKKYLLVRGVGYKFNKKNKYISLQIGYSHKINILIPSFVKLNLNRKATKFNFRTTNLAFLTGLLSRIRKYRIPDVYKGKGIRYIKDNIRIKEGKKKKTF